MPVPLKYTYLVGVIVSFIPWIIFYWLRKDLRKEMLVMGALVSIGGILAQYFWWTKDWWLPQTITGTRVGIEDVLNGFSSGGIAAVLYEEVFKKRVYKYRAKNHGWGALTIAITFFVIAAYSIHVLNFKSFLSTSLAMLFSGIVLIVLRKDLIYDALLTGICMMIGVMPFYFALQYISPGFIENTWAMKNLSGINFLAIPVEDLFFYFLFGFFIAPFYLYWKNEKLRRIPR